MARGSSSSILNKLNLNRKFLVIYVFCVIIPLVLTDGFILRALIHEYSTDYASARATQIEAYKNEINKTFEYDAVIARAIDENDTINHLLDSGYADPYNYYSAYYSYVENSFFKTLAGLKRDKIQVYVDNPTISNGSYFCQMSRAENEKWYKMFMESGKKEALLVYYDETDLVSEKKKFIYAIKSQNKNSKVNKIITISNDISALSSTFKEIPSTSSIYVCTNDEFVPFSNVGDNIPFSRVQEQYANRGGKTMVPFEQGGTQFSIYAFSDDNTVLAVIKNNRTTLFMLIVVTLILPILIMRVIENSIIRRINTLQEAFVGSKNQTFRIIKDIDGSDEISSLMKNYNKMVRINNELTNTIYKEKLKEQETDIARKNAELLALQSQINPHFLFNALESIRMHSVLKGEDETAEMVAKLAVMERQNVDWQDDSVTVGNEAEFIKAYLQLQSYRFGDRLSFDIDIEDDCEDYLIPKLTLVTFVENACVHGIESKSSQGWIFVRVYKEEEEGNLCIEVEDTGDGMSEKDVVELSKRMNSVTIDMIKKYKHVGILNACLRMRMMFNEKAKFYVDSEQGVGMAVVIKIPIESLTKRG